MLDLIHIQNILQHQLKQWENYPDCATPEAVVSLGLMIAAIAEGRVQITPRAS
jgi:hypothetical protein